MQLVHEEVQHIRFHPRRWLQMKRRGLAFHCQPFVFDAVACETSLALLWELSHLSLNRSTGYPPAPDKYGAPAVEG